jgi:hypothetical protein
MDEVLLFESFRRRWPDATDEDGGDPLLVLGHTHLPLAAPTVPGTGERWWRYRNAGSGVVPRTVTAVEWDGPASLAAGRPVSRLVAWCYRDDLPDGGVDAEPAGEDALGRPVVRLELSPSGAGGVLVPRQAATA